MAERSHPPTLIRLVERCLEDECRIEADTTLVVAVSGGPDSMALLDVLGRLSAKGRFRLVACGVDHGLRAAAAAELDLAAALAERWATPFVRVAVTIDGTRNVQENAREARYEALRRVASERGASFVVTAHHADDRAETVLSRLLRGAGPRGLAVLPARSADLLRPMIRARRSDVLLHVRRHGLSVADDPSNQDPRFLRARLRHELMPRLVELSPAVVGHLTALADQLAELVSKVDDEAELVDDAGEVVRLNREQAAQLAKMRKQPRESRAVRVPLSGSRELVFAEHGEAPAIVSLESKNE